MTTQLKIILLALLAIMIVIVILQNTAPVEAKLLLVTLTMPRAVLLLIVALAGYVLGLLTAAVLNARRGRRKA